MAVSIHRRRLLACSLMGTSESRLEVNLKEIKVEEAAVVEMGTSGIPDSCLSKSPRLDARVEGGDCRHSGDHDQPNL